MDFKPAFSRAASPVSGALTLHQAIIRELPHLAGLPVENPKRGENSHTLIIGDQVFKGLRHAYLDQLFLREISLLWHLQGRGLKTPEVTYEGTEAYYFAMKRVEGISPTYAHINTLSGRDLQAFANSAGAFHAGLAASMTPAEAQAHFGKDYTPYAELMAMRFAMDSDDVLIAAFDGDNKSIRKMLADYLDGTGKRTPVVSHGDFQTSNIFLHQEKPEISAVIDLGGATWKLPEFALLQMDALYGKQAAQAMIKACYRHDQRFDPLNMVMLRLCLDLQRAKSDARRGYDTAAYVAGARDAIERARTDLDTYWRPMPTRGVTPCFYP